MKATRFLAGAAAVLAAAALAGVALVAVHVGLFAQPEETPQPESARVGVTAVTRQDIASVVTLAASSSDRPLISVVAPTAGTVDYPRGLAPGRLLPAGTVVATLDGANLVTPVDAYFESALLAGKTRVGAGSQLAVLRYVGFGMVGEVPPADAYRLLGGQFGAKTSINSGPSGVPCIALVPSADTIGTIAALACLIDPGLPMFDGLAGTVVISGATVEDALVLPVTSVAGTAARGEVWLVTNSGPERRSVELGITNGAVVEIISGLDEGDEVLEVPPGLLDL